MKRFFLKGSFAEFLRKNAKNAETAKRNLPALSSAGRQLRISADVHVLAWRWAGCRKNGIAVRILRR